MSKCYLHSIQSYAQVESLVAIILLSLCSPDCMKFRVKYILDNYQVTFLTKDFYLSVINHANYFNRILLGFSVFHCFLSLLLIYSSYYCVRRFLVSWLICDGARLTVLLVWTISILLTIRENDSDLGLLIPATLFSSFLHMFLLYCWACPLSLYQALTRNIKVTPTVREFVPTITQDGLNPDINHIYNFYPSLHQAYN